MKNVAIYQMVLPQYRIDFFNKLNENPNFNITIYCGEKFRSKPKSILENAQFNFFIHSNSSFFKRDIFWQKNIKIPSYFKPNDVIILEGNFKIISNYKLIITALFKRIKIIWWSHGIGVKAKWYKIFLKKFLLLFIDKLILYNESELKYYHLLGFNQKKIFYVNNTINIEKIKIEKSNWSTDSIKDFKFENNIHNKKIILFCGRLIPEKELDLSLLALKILLKKDKNFKFVIIGDGIEKNKLRKLCEKLTLQANVIWVGELFKQKELAPWFLSSDLFLYPGPIGLSVLHAFSYGLPIITNDNYNLHGPEFSTFINNKHGLLFAHKDVNDLALKINEFFKNKKSQKKYKKNILNLIESNYSLENMAQFFSNILIK